ncbi:bifunctional ADP-dependent NAD(P)H-hydrate dehydratase/NAD(P)H-hydrate epimerase [Actinomyces haliotis]|uniref:bifunctional ADP-dependent NAD(P)H-hydrate dehydratase/NAD(P)H-hydrate epimerase n=1 Tax=Actinomyces haliotis TaxID=1280843 RepID=UPI00188F0BD8|nr:bifunctional ADP-dependent NAD(P)H-hydrate dehydratase/NAD(P)H-hydrate epimerase [Actinomyces haliotis]
MTTVTTTMTEPRTLEPHRAHRAGAIGGAEAPLTRGTDRYMEAAAHALALAATEELRLARGAVRGSRVLLLVGGGHNGGDALLAGARLAASGCRVTALLATQHPHPAALERARAARVELLAVSEQDASEHAAALAAGTDLVVDGLTGIGAAGPLRPLPAALVTPLVDAGERGHRPFRVLAVDLPSGTGVDDGTLPGPVLVADRTVTFTCPRAAHLLPPAAQRCGLLDVVDLGLPVPEDAPLVERPSDAELGALLRVPGDADHKYTRGVVGLLAGSESYPGAALLATTASVRAGAGMSRILASRRVVDLVLAVRPEAVPSAGRCQCLVLGPGTAPTDDPTSPEHARTEELRTALGEALDDEAPAVVDAGALPLLPGLLREGRRCSPVHVLTPHAGEAADLLTALGEARTRSEVDAAPSAAAQRLAALTGATVVLKGTPTLVARANPGHGAPLLSLDAGPGWLATAGSGDVLAGTLGALLAAARADEENGRRALDPAAVAALAVRLHATAGRLAAERTGASPDGGPVAALDVALALPVAWRRLHDAGRGVGGAVAV